ncbi:MAG: D-alanine--D-alanine ligase [Firmicutes bacterium]|nr:D-alanine--D-alanine ligase [Bacillota bacterium]
MNKKNILVLFGGCSPEHEISKKSAMAVIQSLSEDKYNIIPVYITQEGKWLLYDGAIDNLRSVSWEKYGTNAVLSPDRVNRGLLRIVGEKVKNIPVDVIFPVLHGPLGEDGTVQGLFELSGIPYVGCGVAASAVSMDKTLTKILAEKAGLLQAEYAWFNAWDKERAAAVVKKIRSKPGYPCFVKPASSGSSIGVSKASNKKELDRAIAAASAVDGKIVIEKAIDGRELECAVLGAGDEVFASGVGEILPAADFYDFDAKYNNAGSKTVVKADIPEETAEAIRETAIKAFRAVGGAGLARVDFFLENGTNRVIFNEINTMPGFTPISMYPMLWQAEGVSLPELCDRLIALALRGCELGE